ncbi:MAG: hypothetical protein GF364_11410, partial [Candidatus Lokiarchaeota archaeon]|nr:hypothetical protein [Candidatus Lokiarchaeota archaeon]
VHDHQSKIDDAETQQEIKSYLAEQAKDHSEINKVVLKDAISEVDGIYLSIEIETSENISVIDAHMIAEILELQLRLKFRDIRRCIIHTRPNLE